MLQDQVVLIGKVQDQSMLLAVCRNTGNTAFKGFFRRFIDNLFSPASSRCRILPS